MPLKVYAAIPMMDEYSDAARLIDDLNAQKGVEWCAVICVNQPDAWWNQPSKSDICISNKATIELLNRIHQTNITIIDKCSRGNGWDDKNYGVGWARRLAMDAVSAAGSNSDILVSMDADTRYPPDFFKSLTDAFERHSQAEALAAPYYHPITGDEETDRCMLRYEIYMRHYALNMLTINNPYAYTAIGSGMACRIGAYRKLGGISPKLSGEDFYFMMKLRKFSKVIVDSDIIIEPASRFSDRVFFGTGPAMIKGRAGNWDSYPLYHPEAFGKIAETYEGFEKIYHANAPDALPMENYLKKLFKTDDLWTPLRQNSTTPKQFAKACMQKANALRILQYLKETNHEFSDSNEERLIKFIEPLGTGNKDMINAFTSFENASVEQLNRIRNFMAETEWNLLKTKQLI